MRTIRPAGASVVLALLLAACAAPTIEHRLPAPGETSRPLWVVGHGWHVGLALRLADVSPALWPESRALGAYRYVEVGWGDGKFYPASRGTSGLALKAAFASTSSVLHVAAFDPAPADFFAGAPVVEVALSPAGFEAVCRFIHGEYAVDAAGRPIAAEAGLYGTSRFYQARRPYRVLDNSNTWTGRALWAGGLPIDYRALLTAASVLEAAARFGPVVSQPRTE